MLAPAHYFDILPDANKVFSSVDRSLFTESHEKLKNKNSKAKIIQMDEFQGLCTGYLLQMCVRLPVYYKNVFFFFHALVYPISAKIIIIMILSSSILSQTYCVV